MSWLDEYYSSPHHRKVEHDDGSTTYEVSLDGEAWKAIYRTSPVCRFCGKGEGDGEIIIQRACGGCRQTWGT